MINLFGLTEEMNWAINGSAGVLLSLTTGLLSRYGQIYYQHKKTLKGTTTYADRQEPLSVIIAAHNQGEALKNNLPYILEQDYPDFEVIVINDASNDDSEEVLKNMEAKYPNLYHTFTPESARYVSHRKLALTLGVRASKNEWLVFTNANCKPDSDQWLKLMARNFTKGTNVVLGYSNYERKKSAFNSRIVFERLMQQIGSFSTVFSNGNALTGSGSNMAYRKSVFMKHEGFKNCLNLKFGEDAMFVNQIHRAHTARVETDPNSVVRQQMPYSKADWYEDKVYERETSKHLKDMTLFRIHWASFYLINYLLLAWAVAETANLLMFTYNADGERVGLKELFEYVDNAPQQIELIAGVSFVWLLMLTTWLLRSLMLKKTCKLLNENRYFFSLPILEYIQPLRNQMHRLRHMFRRKKDFRKN